MPLGFTEGSTKTTASFFAIFEAFVISIGWTVVAGAGTTNMVISSTGESGLLNKLFVHAWAATATTLRFEVQDDAVGTHATTEPGVLYISTTFNQYYALAGDKDYLVIHTHCTTERRTYYVGLLLPIFNAALDETYRMIAALLDPVTANCKLLRNAAGAWDSNQAVNSNTFFAQAMGTFYPGSYMALHPCPIGTGVNLCGTLKNVSLFDFRRGIQGDIFTSAYIGASRWMKQGRVAFMISGTPPVFTDDSVNFIHNVLNTNVRLDIFDLLIKPTLLANGWVETDNKAISGFDRDSFFYNIGEDGLSEITIRIYIQPAANSYYGAVYNRLKTQSTIAAPMYTALSHTGVMQDLYSLCDRDCFVAYTGVSSFGYFGKMLSYVPHSLVVGDDTSYASIATYPRLTTDITILKDAYNSNWYPPAFAAYISGQVMDGTWSKPSSLNAFDNRAKMFPITVSCQSGGPGAGSAVKNIPVGQLKYCYSVQGAVVAGDTLTVGAKTYRVVRINPAGTDYFFAVREV